MEQCRKRKGQREYNRERVLKKNELACGQEEAYIVVLKHFVHGRDNRREVSKCFFLDCVGGGVGAHYSELRGALPVVAVIRHQLVDGGALHQLTKRGEKNRGKWPEMQQERDAGSCMVDADE